ncbi:CHAD domain-containing protein [Thermanaerothrix sp.]|jgi:CHAD domain-containing protein|uniref:CHAD domain-containing protein n=1 Tax=Thermanaerothrix sp. TaxID=2972675 RepID=UPI002ADD821A|nr:CHAD domain-containing protein [Thermanaerothrix sp.]
MPEIWLLRGYGSEILLKHLKGLVGEIEGVRANTDIEPVHRMRVACRRLRSLLPVFGPYLAPKRYKRWRRAFRKLGRALGSARDTDIHIERVKTFLQEVGKRERPGIARLLLRLMQQRSALQVDVLDALVAFEQSGVADEMREVLVPLAAMVKGMTWSLVADAGLSELARQTIRERLSDFLALQAYVERPECVNELHLMRIRAKHLRYTLEAFSPLYGDSLKPYVQAARTCQELLGAVHDLDVWLLYLPEFSIQEYERTLSYYGHVRPFARLQPGLTAFENYCRAERHRAYAHFQETWRGWQNARVWDSLSEWLDRVSDKDAMTVPQVGGSPAEG